jgi:hypothetical protein
MKYIKLLSTITTHNKYYTWYANICQSAKQRNLQKGCGIYIEKHHIIPKSFGLGGVADPENLVSLTAREHYIAHLLLSKMFTDKTYRNKMQYALWRLTTRKVNYIPNSHSYEYARKQAVELAKNKIDSLDTRSKKARPGKLNGMWGRTHTQEVKDKLATIAIKNLAGKTYEDLYGIERADQLKKDRSIKLKDYLQKNPEKRQGKNNSNSKKYKFIDPSKKTYIVEGNLKSFCKQNSLDTGSVIACVKGRRASYKGWTIHYC